MTGAVVARVADANIPVADLIGRFTEIDRYGFPNEFTVFDSYNSWEYEAMSGGLKLLWLLLLLLTVVRDKGDNDNEDNGDDGPMDVDKSWLGDDVISKMGAGNGTQPFMWHALQFTKLSSSTLMLFNLVEGYPK